MGKIKFLLQFVIAFCVALGAYVFAYQPNQEQVQTTIISGVEQGKKQAEQLVEKKQKPESKPQKEPAVANNTGNTKPVQGKLKITLLDVNHGDSILLQDSKQNILVDVGHNKNGQLFFKKLDQRGVQKINTVIVTHHHADHMGNIMKVAGRYKVSRIYDNGLVNTGNPTSVKLHDILSKGNYKNRKLQAGDTINLGDGFWMEVLSPGDFLEDYLRKDLNNNSIVMLLHYGKFTMMFTGDIENPTEAALAKKYGSKLKADVLKVAHHGSKTSSNYRFISKVQPKYALISCGAFEEYHHPNKDVLGRLKHLGAEVYYTNANGDITITTDGKSYEVKTEK